jgi:NAD(P)-dependent dehydrogenase (short-subunit alcohol dehydrogenase family)
MSENRMCEGRVCIVTGAGRGLGREYALSLARYGAKVVVNDLGGSRDGTGADASPAQEVVDEIKAAGGEAVANTDDISSWDGAAGLIQQAIDTFGRLDVLINNAGILRDRMLFTMSEEEWDAVIRVHLKGTFAPSHHAAAYWRERSKAGETNDARLINTTSVSGLYANAGQTNYGAAKAGIAAFTQIAAIELGRYGVTANCIAPGALTRLTGDLDNIPDEVRANFAPTWVAPGRHMAGVGRLGRGDGPGDRGLRGWCWRSPRVGIAGPSTKPVESAEEVGSIVRKLLADARPRTLFNEAN